MTEENRPEDEMNAQSRRRRNAIGIAASIAPKSEREAMQEYLRALSEREAELALQYGEEYLNTPEAIEDKHNYAASVSPEGEKAFIDLLDRAEKQEGPHSAGQG